VQGRRAIVVRIRHRAAHLHHPTPLNPAIVKGPDVNSDSSVPDVLGLEVGQEYEIRLRSDNSDYVWVANTLADCVTVSRTREKDVTGAIGGALDEIVLIRALSPGTAIVRLEQRHPWTAGPGPITALVRVTIHAGEPDPARPGEPDPGFGHADQASS
jgi:hypothetical protein